MVKRNIIQIDRDKCDGCGLCASACAEGAIRIRGGKAELVSDTYCDGLGACLGECPQGAITIIQREADSFDQEAADRHVAQQAAKQGRAVASHAPTPAHAASNTSAAPTLPCGCPGTNVRTFATMGATSGATMRGGEARGGSPSACPSGAAGGAASSAGESALGHWPVQLRLVPPGAAFLRGADLLLAADCVPFAMADFHQRLLRGRVVLVGCPKLDDAAAYVDKLAAILAEALPRRLTVVHMEVPCCTGLVRIAQEALARSGRDIPLEDITVSLRGEAM